MPFVNSFINLLVICYVRCHEIPIAINNLEYEKINTIARLTNKSPSIFMPYDEINTNDFGQVKMERIKIGQYKFADLFVVQMHSTQYFLFYENALIFRTKNVMSIEPIADNTKSFFNIKTYLSSDIKFLKDTSYFIPTVYQYAVHSKKYKRIQFKEK